MAIASKPAGTTLKIMLNKTVDGKTKTVTRSYSKIKPDATDAAVYNTADALQSLQVNPLNRVLRDDSTELLETV